MQSFWNNRDEEADESMSCYFCWVDTPSTLSDYQSKKTSNDQATHRAQISSIRDPMRRTRYQGKERKVEKTEGRSRNDRKILMLEVLHARHVC